MDYTNILNNSLKDHLIVSNYNKDVLKGPELCVGIDEAGRGPVLGPMVYAALFCPRDQEQKLKEMECADSKTLTEEQREEILEKINTENSFCGYAVKVLSPHTISTSMLRRVKYNLNDISHDTAMSLIDELWNNQKLNIGIVYLDTVGDPSKYEAKLKARFPKLTFKVSKKADSLYPCVSAASICAKVTRDGVIKNWKFIENIKNNEELAYGSGYPGDPETKKFLDKTIHKVFGFVRFVRFGWSTASQKINMKCATIKWIDNFADDDIEEDDEDGTSKAKMKPLKTKAKSESAKDNSSLSILNFFAQKPKKRNYSAIDNSEILTKKALKFVNDF